MAKGIKNIEKNLFKNLKPIEIKSEKKKPIERKVEEKGAEDNKKDVSNDFGRDSNFSDNSVWQTKAFVAPILNESKERQAPLETTADEMPFQNQNTNNKNEITYASTGKSESAAYRISSDYEGTRKSYESDKRDNPTTTPSMGLGEQRRQVISNPFIRREETEMSGLEEFSRLESQERREREKRDTLPFMKKKDEGEIF